MPDHAVSTSPAVQAQLDRLWALSPGADVLGLDRIAALCAALGNPQAHLPPVFHVAGTNGKGSTCAFLRSCLEAAGHRVHAYTSPHLVRFNERIRVAGTLIGDDALAPLLAEVLDAAEAAGISASFFEVTTAAAFLAFARTPADACVIEVGLGGRLDATNVIPAPLICGIASLGIDHEAFLLAPEAGTPDDPMARIAFEKAGIAKPGVPLVTHAYDRRAAEAVAGVAARMGAPLLVRERDWWLSEDGEGWRYRDAAGALTLPRPALPGAHQLSNAALAVAMLRHQRALAVTEAALAEGISATRWPARMQRMAAGPLTALAEGRTVWLDGGHNPDAGAALARAIDAPVRLIIGLLANKDALGFLEPLRDRILDVHAVPIPGHAHHDPKDLCWMIQHGLGIRVANPVDNLEVALRRIADRPGNEPVLIAGSLYLAGEALRLNDEWPT